MSTHMIFPGYNTSPDWVTTKRSDIYPLIDYRENPKLKDAVNGASVLVTGAGTGIGKAIAEEFAQAGAATVIVTGRRTAPLEETKASIAKLAPECTVIVASMDVSSPESVEAVFASLEGPDGPGVPNVLVNNSAYGGGDAIASVDRPWDKIMEIWGTNLLGPYICSRAFIPRQGGKPATIINVTSIGAILLVPGKSDYGVTKVALNRFTETLQIENEAAAIRVFAIHPGAVLATEQGAKIPEEYHPICTETTRLAGGVSLWLLTPDADFLKGRYVDCTWDLEELAGERGRVVQGDLFKTRVSMG